MMRAHRRLPLEVPLVARKSVPDKLFLRSELNPGGEECRVEVSPYFLRDLGDREDEG